MRQFIILVLGIIMTVLWGCSESTAPDPSETDEQAIIQVIQDIENSEDEDYLYSTLDDESDNAFFETSESALLKPIIPVRFGRIGFRPIIRDVRVVFDTDSTATAEFTTLLRGHFVVLTLDSAFEVQRIVRRMGHKFKRIAHFVKRGNEDQSLRERWKLVDFSMVLGVSLGLVDSTAVSTTINIQKLIIEADSVIEIENPLEYFQTRKSVFSFEPGTEVKLTVIVENTNPNAIQVPAGKGTELVRLHFARHRRLRLHGVRYFQWVRGEGNVNVYEGTWTIGQHFRVNHAAIDVIDNGCLFDDEVNKYPYNSVTWGTPYRVTPLN